MAFKDFRENAWESEEMTSYGVESAIKEPTIRAYRIAESDVPSFIEEANRIADSEFDGNRYLKVLGSQKIGDRIVMTGSNSVILPIVRRLVPSKRVGRPEDFQITLNDGDTLEIRGNNYVDMGVVLDFAGRNHEMALDFYNQIPEGERLKLLEQGLPAVVLDYGLKKLPESSYGLGLVHNEGSTILRPSAILAGKTGAFRNEDVSLEDGLPRQLSGGDRNLYTATQKPVSVENLGLSGLVLGGGRSVGSGSEGLGISNSSGRVVLF